MYIYYVYAYLRKKDNTPYYIGKGKKNRAYGKNHRIKPPKDKSKIVFYQTNLLEIDAFKLEIAYIKLFGRKDIGTGILRNITDGGEGHSNPSNETRNKISLGRKNYWENLSAADLFQISNDASIKTIEYYQNNPDAKIHLSSKAKMQIINGKNKLIGGEIQRKVQIDLVLNNVHRWQGDGSYQREIQQQLISEGRHHLVGGILQKKASKDRIENGTDNTIKTIICPHCGKIGQYLIMKRWHFDNCKFKCD
jgi:hypothetical protein